MGNIYLLIDKDWFEKNKAHVLKKYKDATNGEEGYGFDIDTKKEEISNNGLTLSLSLPGKDDNAPYISIEYDLDTEDLVKLAEILIKRLNKAKSYHEIMDE